MEQIPAFEQNNWNQIADELFALQALENDGRGVSCVRSVVDFIRLGRIEEAKRIAFWDHDKIVNYPKLKEFIKTKLFKPKEEHPWSFLEKLQAQTKKRKK